MASLHLFYNQWKKEDGAGALPICFERRMANGGTPAAGGCKVCSGC